jgi:hypothetical protein
MQVRNWWGTCGATGTPFTCMYSFILQFQVFCSVFCLFFFVLNYYIICFLTVTASCSSHLIVVSWTNQSLAPNHPKKDENKRRVHCFGEQMRRSELNQTLCTSCSAIFPCLILLTRMCLVMKFNYTFHSRCSILYLRVALSLHVLNMGH